MPVLVCLPPFSPCSGAAVPARKTGCAQHKTGRPKALARWYEALEVGKVELQRQDSRGPVSLACKCTPKTLPASDYHTAWPRVIRASKGIAKAGKIRCEYCGELFEVREAPRRRTGSTGILRQA
jgi:hypothetical protein